MGSALEIDLDPDSDLHVVPRHQGQTGTGCYKLHDHRIHDYRVAAEDRQTERHRLLQHQYSPPLQQQQQQEPGQHILDMPIQQHRQASRQLSSPSHKSMVGSNGRGNSSQTMHV
jgi:hypothetical protein